MRYALKLSYDGTNYHGWQVQPNAHSVQAEIEDKLSRFFNDKIQVVGCGRTDTGVHAKEYVLHFDYSEVIDTEIIAFKLNVFFDQSIVIHKIKLVSNSFHARFDAINRTYKYFVHTNKNPFLNHYSHRIFKHLDFDAMNSAAQKLLNHQDFTSFSKLHTDSKTNLCLVKSAKWHQENEQWFFEISANRFLRNMVRAIVGTLLHVGENKITLDQFDGIILSKNRNLAGESVAAKALFLWKVEYEELK